MGLVLSKKIIQKSYPQISDVKKFIQREKSYPNFFIQINATLYQRNDATPKTTVIKSGKISKFKFE